MKNVINEHTRKRINIAGSDSYWSNNVMMLLCCSTFIVIAHKVLISILCNITAGFKGTLSRLKSLRKSISNLGRRESLKCFSPQTVTYTVCIRFYWNIKDQNQPTQLNTYKISLLMRYL